MAGTPARLAGAAGGLGESRVSGEDVVVEDFPALRAAPARTSVAGGAGRRRGSGMGEEV